MSASWLALDLTSSGSASAQRFVAARVRARKALARLSCAVLQSGAKAEFRLRIVALMERLQTLNERIALGKRKRGKEKEVSDPHRP